MSVDLSTSSWVRSGIYSDADAEFYLSASRVVLNVETLSKARYITNVCDLFFNIWNPIPHQMGRFRDLCRQVNYKGTARALEIAIKMFQYIDLRDRLSAQNAFDFLKLEVAEISRAQGLKENPFIGHDLILIDQCANLRIHQRLCFHELNEITDLYQRLEQNQLNIIICECEALLDFKKDVLFLMRIILTKPMGFDLIKKITEISDKKILIVPSIGASAFVSLEGVPDQLLVLLDFYYSNSLISCYDESKKKRSEFDLRYTALYHELLHAYHEIKGGRCSSLEKPRDSSFTNAEEEWTILGATQIEDPLSNAKIEKTHCFSENQFREQADLRLRSAHYSISGVPDLSSFFLNAVSYNFLGDVEALFRAKFSFSYEILHEALSIASQQQLHDMIRAIMRHLADKYSIDYSLVPSSEPLASPSRNLVEGPSITASRVENSPSLFKRKKNKPPRTMKQASALLSYSRKRKCPEAGTPS